MADFTKAHWFTAKWEGGISDHPLDRGGYTAFGVCTEFMKDFAANAANREFLKELGLSGVVNRAYMKKITAQIAAKIFKRAFWEPLKVEDLPQALATCLYDCAVNSGRATSIRLAQRAANNLGKKLSVDGINGPLTRAALISLGDKITPQVLDERYKYFLAIVNARPNQKVFLKGWLNRLDDLRKYVAKL